MTKYKLDKKMTKPAKKSVYIVVERYDIKNTSDSQKITNYN